MCPGTSSIDELRFVNFFAIHNGGNDVGLLNLCKIVVHEVTIQNCKVGELAQADGTHPVLFMPHIGHIAREGLQCLMAADSLVDISDILIRL